MTYVEPDRWNGWILRTSPPPTLDYKLGRREVYRVWLRECTSSAGVLDWICQVASKTWANDECLAGLARALNDVLHPQATLCGFDRDEHITVRRIDSLVAAARRPRLQGE